MRKAVGAVLLFLSLGPIVGLLRNGLPTGGSTAYMAGRLIGTFGIGGGLLLGGLYLLLTEGRDRGGSRRRTKRRGEGRDDLVTPAARPVAPKKKPRRHRPPPGFD